MIDTDKYTGHTPAPWVIEEGDMEYGETDTIITVTPPMNFVVANGIMRQDAQLIADAPLLLAEVKRLREEKTFLWETYLKESAEVKRLRGLLDVIVDITLKELKIFDDNCPMINIRDLAYKGILWGNKE